MKRTPQSFAAFAFALCAVSVSPAAPGFKDLQKIYNEAKTSIENAHEKRLAGIGEEYAKQLGVLTEQAKNKGDLRGYKKLVSERERFSGEKTIPEDSSFSRHAGAAERDRISEVIALSGKYVARLEKLKIALMKEDKIADAEAVDVEIQRIKFNVADLETTRPSLPAGAVQAGNPAPPPSFTRGLVLHYDFNTRGEGNKVKDLSGHGNDGKVSGAKWLANGRGLRNGTYVFDGKDDSIVVPHNPSLVFKDGLTVALWARIDNDGRQQGLVSKYHVKSKQRGFALDYNDMRHPGTPRRTLTATISSKGDPFWGGKVFADMTLTKRGWHHLVLRFSPSSMRVYVDGKHHTGGFCLGSQPRSVFSNNRPLYIGASEETSNDTLDGCIDDIMIWNRALSEEEIEQVYKAPGKDRGKIP